MKAMNDEINAQDKNYNLQDLVSLPEGKKTIGCKWEYTVKCRRNGEIES